MPVPALPRAGFVMRQAQLRFGGLKRVLNRPTLPLDPHQDLERRAGRTPGREERQVLITEAASDQQATGPQAGEILVVLLRLKISEFEISPVVQACSLGAVARRQARPSLGRKSLRNLLGRAGHFGFVDPGREL